MVHPFPSVLDGVVVAAVALLAGGSVATASRLGVSMTALQFAIGALNDIVDEPADAGRIPPKPIPAGSVGVGTARGVVVITAGIGLLLAVPSGAATLLVAILVLLVGGAYDLFAKGTAWSWLPFAVGIPLLPVYGWLGVSGALPQSFAILLPMAVLAGAGLAVANARVDLDTDRVSGTQSVATALGARGSWWVGLALMAAATGLGVLMGDPLAWPLLPLALVVTGTLVVLSGIVVGRGTTAKARRRAWEAQAVGAAIAATGWVAGLLPRP
ncbi:MAG TPA: UbiA family prenyltransferase [Candidatus Limnocylindrales bacterium]|nr:UbiA family prenyltransferase [Candidatus Limnocylindrales bacterium]